MVADPCLVNMVHIDDFEVNLVSELEVGVVWVVLLLLYLECRILLFFIWVYLEHTVI